MSLLDDISLLSLLSATFMYTKGAFSSATLPPPAERTERRKRRDAMQEFLKTKTIPALQAAGATNGPDIAHLLVPTMILFHDVHNNPPGTINTAHIITKLRDYNPVPTDRPVFDEFVVKANFAEWHKHLAVIIVTTDIFELIDQCLAFHMVQYEAQAQAQKFQARANGPGAEAGDGEPRLGAAYRATSYS